MAEKEENVYDFYPFKIPRLTSNQFFESSEADNIQFMTEDLARSGLRRIDIFACPATLIKQGALAGYIIPYFDLKGNPIQDADGYPFMLRTRLKYPDFSREQRYTQPNKEQLAKAGLPPFLPYIHPQTLKLPGEEMVCAEGEKKTAAIIKHLGIPAFGIGGCQLWRNPDGSGSIHPWIRELLVKRGISRVTITPDGDIHRYDISTAYGNFARALELEGISVRILNPGAKIDDLLVAWKDSAKDNWNHIPSIDPKDLVQSPSALIKRYGLAFKTDAKDRPIVYQHTSNIMRLLEEHDAFPSIWRNSDSNKIYVGEDGIEENLTEVTLANYFQHNLGFDKVTSQVMRVCVGAVARKNSRSPMLDYIRNLEWDGTPRLDTWLSRAWGTGASPYINEISRKWLVSACARMDKPGTKLDWMLIVIGPQGIGKTSMPSILFGEGNYHPLYGEQNDKDLHMLLHSYLCVGFDELDSFGRKETSTLKAMITRNEDAFRPPYGASVEIFPRRMTLYGCGNRHDFLQHDASGYRRYAVIEVEKKLDFELLKNERDQLWAEAWFVYSNGSEAFWEIADASLNAEKFVIANPLQDRIEEFLAVREVNKIGGGRREDRVGTVWFKMTELMMHLGMEHEMTNSARIKDVAAILHKLKIQKPEKASRHPETGAVGRWYIYTPSAPI